MGIVLFASACGGAAESAPSPSPPPPSSSPPPEPPRVSFTPEISTHDISLGVNFDNAKCLWRQTEWVLRDGAGTVIVSGKLPTGEGVIKSVDPLYECVWRMPRIVVQPAESYVFELTTQRINGEKRTKSESFKPADTVRPVYLHFPRL